MSRTASVNQDGQQRRHDYRPRGTVKGTSLFATLRRTVTEFSEDNLSDWAAALTYYGLLAMFPALIALVPLIGPVGDPTSTTNTITQIVTKIGPSSAASTFAGPIKSITSHKSAAGIVGVIGLGVALWSASSYVGAFMRASNVIYETPEGRPIWKLSPRQVLVTLVMLVLLVLVALALVLTGPIVTAVAGPLGIGSIAVKVWDIAKWPVLLLVVITMLAVLFYASPNVKLAGFRWVTPGGLFAVVLCASRLPHSHSTWPISAPTTRLRHPRRLPCFSYGCGLPTPRCCSAWNSTPSVSEAASSKPACPEPNASCNSTRAAPPKAEDHLTTNVSYLQVTQLLFCRGEIL